MILSDVNDKITFFVIATTHKVTINILKDIKE